jgi:hypothetical protein
VPPVFDPKRNGYVTCIFPHPQFTQVPDFNRQPVLAKYIVHLSAHKPSKRRQPRYIRLATRNSRAGTLAASTGNSANRQPPVYQAPPSAARRTHPPVTSSRQPGSALRQSALRPAAPLLQPSPTLAAQQRQSTRDRRQRNAQPQWPTPAAVHEGLAGCQSATHARRLK